MSIDYRARLDRASQALDRQGWDTLILTPGASMFYLTGFDHGHAAERLLALVLHRTGQASWIVPQMNQPQLQSYTTHPIRAWGDGEGFLPALSQAVAGAAHIAFDDEARSAFLLDLAAIAPAARLHKASTIMRQLRMRKDPSEIARLRYAASVVDDSIPEAIALCTRGKRESDLDAELRKLLLTRSPQSAVAFTIIASGPNGAFPHHETSDRMLAPGDVVILDFGIREPHGYHSDITVTCSVGQPADPEVKRVYHTVWQAQAAAIAAAKPGVPCEAVDRAARSVIEQAGYGQHFLHRTGHGLGLQVHEPPYIVAANPDPLEVGNVFSIEPGIYLPGRFGVRLEIIVSIATQGCDLINRQSFSELPTS